MGRFDEMVAKRKQNIEGLKGSASVDLLRARSRESVLLDMETALMEYGVFQCIPGLGDKTIEDEANKNQYYLELVKAFEACDCCAMALYLDEEFYGTSLELLKFLKERLEVPLICRGAFLTAEQIYSLFLGGADALTVCVEDLEPPDLQKLCELISDLGMTPIVEIKKIEQIQLAQGLNPEILAVDWSDSQTQPVDDWKKSLQDLGRLPKLAVEVGAEKNRVLEAVECGFDGILLAPEMANNSSPAALVSSFLELARDQS